MIARNLQEIINISNDSTLTEEEKIFNVRMAAALLACNIMNRYYDYTVNIKTTDCIYISMSFIKASSDRDRRRVDELVFTTANTFTNNLLIDGKLTIRYDDEQMIFYGSEQDEYSDHLVNARLDTSDGSQVVDSLLYMLTCIFGYDELQIIKRCLQSCANITATSDYYADDRRKEKDIMVAKQIGMRVYQ